MEANADEKADESVKIRNLLPTGWAKKKVLGWGSIAIAHSPALPLFSSSNKRKNLAYISRI